MGRRLDRVCVLLLGQGGLGGGRLRVLGVEHRFRRGGQARQALDNLGAVLQAAGMDYADVVKTTVFLKDMNDFAAMNEVYATFFPNDPPARSAVEVARLPKDAMVEIEAIAVR